MADSKVYIALTSSWAAVEGAAASIPGVTWQNDGPGEAMIAFTPTAPAGGPTDAVHILLRGGAFYDVNGSAKVWARSASGAALSATAD